MKIKPIPINKMQKALNQIIKASKFVWRHFFVISLLVLLVIAFIDAPAINWKVFVTYLSVAVSLDWLKTKIKFTNNSVNTLNEIKPPISIGSDSTKSGSSAWNCNPFNVGSSAYYTRTSRYH